jgi:photosystem II stability/assembly factor-like uncharacterized protein
MISISNGGDNVYVGKTPSDLLAAGTVDGVAILQRANGQWTLKTHALRGGNFSAVTQASDGTLFAASHGMGVARSTDQGESWTWVNKGLDHFDLWSARAGKLMGKDVVCVGALPAHLYISEDNGESWRELPAMRKVPSVSQWCFPPAPRIGHVKDIVFDGDALMVGIEIGALLVSHDLGASFAELPIDPNPVERDIHRILLHKDRPNRLIVANGIVGVMTSEDRGRTWAKNPMLKGAEYPDPIAIHPHDPDMIFLTGGDGWPPHWYKRGRGRGKILRSRDAGKSWERLLGGLPDGQRAVFGGLTIEAWDGGSALYAADTDGQVFESRDDGDHWTIIADVPPVSKGEFYRALVRERPKLASVDDMAFSKAATDRLQALKT